MAATTPSSTEVMDARKTKILARFTLAGDVSTDQYDKAMRRLEESGHWLPEGLEYHVAFRSNGNLRVSEIWGSRGQFDAFGEHLMPLLKDEGIEFRGDPEMLEIYNIVKP